MAKAKKSKAKSAEVPEVEPHRDPFSTADVETAIAALRSYYDEGRESLRENPDRVEYGTSSELLRKARVFASRYSKSDLNRLESLCRKYKTVLGRSLVDRLATIHDTQVRQEIEERAIRLRWSKIWVDREIRSRFGRRRSLGRSPHRPKDATEALSEIVRLCLKLTRWGEVMGWTPVTGRVEPSSKDVEAVLGELPDHLVDKLKKALRAALNLQEAAERELGSGE